MGLTPAATNLVWDGEIDSQPKRSTLSAASHPARGHRKLFRSVWLGSPAPVSAPEVRSVGIGSFVMGLAGGVALFARLTWTVITLPFRILVGILAVLGRIAGLVTGFSLMVGGAALFPSAFALVGVAVFGLGLVMTLRSVE